MKVLVIGSGGREHALVWKLRQSPRVSQVYCAPGNGGIAEEAECLPADVKSLDSLVAVAEQIRPDLTVVGPELPLSLGSGGRIYPARLARLRADARQRRNWSPARASPRNFCSDIAFPRRILPSATPSTKSLRPCRIFHAPVVVKADGLAAGKGVVICRTKEEAASAAAEMFSGKMLGEAGRRVVLEECLQGDELSFLVLSDGERVAPLVAAQDHKRIGDGDTGPNTGGMGAYSTASIVDEPMTQWLLQHVARPVVAGMKAEGAEYKGILYCGLMMTARGPMVLEFNCRFGDPETQPILMRLESDLLEALEASIEGRVSEGDFRWSQDASVCVVMSSGRISRALSRSARRSWASKKQGRWKA